MIFCCLKILGIRLLFLDVIAVLDLIRGNYDFLACNCAGGTSVLVL